MKTHCPPHRGRPQPRAFTLIELLVVIAIISILAALTMGTFSYAQKAAARNRTTAGLHTIINALEVYKEKFGEYPEPADPDKMSSSGSSIQRIGGSLMLYQAITGDGYDNIKGAEKSSPKGPSVSDGKVDADEGANSIKGDLPKTMVLNTADGYSLVDGFGHPYQYDKPPTDPSATNNSVNATFDVWSYAQKDATDYSLGGKKDDRNTAVWIKNW